MAQGERTIADASLITVTFMFTDIEGSTALWEQETAAMRVALQRHNVLLTAAVERFGGHVFKTVGDAFCVTFDDAAAALGAACLMQTSLAAETWPTRTPLRVRIVLHTGPAYASAGDYFGTTINRCARLLAVARGGQTLLTSVTAAQVRSALPADTSLSDMGILRLRDLAHPVHVFQLMHAGLSPSLFDLAEVTGGGKLTAQPLARFKPLDLYDVPTLPAVVVQALRIMQDPRSDAKAVEDVIAPDPAISAKILRVANSAYFGRSRRVATIADAVRVLGFTNVQGMIIGLGAFDAFRTERLSLTDFWKHSIAVATAARFLAPRVNCAADEAFTAGILHDIGKLIFAVQAEQVYQQVLELQRQARVQSLEAERTLFEFTHAEVGQTVAERWALPGKYVAAIAFHHDPAAAEERATFCALIGLADLAAHAALADQAAVVDDAQRDALQEILRLGPADWQQCVDHLHEATENIDAFAGAIR